MTPVQQPPAVEEGRKAKRLRPPMSCCWGTNEVCPRGGKITSLTIEGCFIKTKAEVVDGQTIFVNCWMPTERWLSLRGEVAYHLPRVGFGLNFTGLSDSERELLSMLLEFYGEDAQAV